MFNKSFVKLVPFVVLCIYVACIWSLCRLKKATNEKTFHNRRDRISSNKTTELSGIVSMGPE